MNRASLAGLVLAAVMSGACLVNSEHVSDPEPAFDKARIQAARVAGRSRPAHQLHLLAYDPDDRELTRVNVPLWLLRQVKGDLDFEDDEVPRKLGRHLRWQDIEDAGPGVLVELNEDAGDRVLVWLE